MLVFLFPDSMFTTPGAQVMRGTAWQLSPKQEPTLESTALDFEVSFWFGSLAVPALVLYAMESVRDSLFSSLGSTILELACLSFWLLSAMVKSHPTAWGILCSFQIFPVAEWGQAAHEFNPGCVLFWERTSPMKASAGGDQSARGPTLVCKKGKRKLETWSLQHEKI